VFDIRNNFSKLANMSVLVVFMYFQVLIFVYPDFSHNSSVFNVSILF